MTRLKYPTNGIYNTVKSELDDCIQALNSASSNSNNTIPIKFTYKGYLNSLESTLRDYLKEINEIKSKIKATSKTFEDLELDMTEKSNVIGDYKVIERDRMII